MTCKKLLSPFIIAFVLIHFYSCDSNEPLTPNRTITIINESSSPIVDVIVNIDAKEYRTNIKGQTKIFLNNTPREIDFSFQKEGYQAIRFRVPNSFFGFDDTFTLRKIQIAEPDTSSIIEEEPLLEEEVVIKPKPKIIPETKVVDNETTPIILTKNYSEVYEEAEFYKDEKNWAKAVELYQRINNDDLDLYTKAKYNSGVIRQQYLNDFNEAINDYTAALETNNSKNFAEIYYGRGVCNYSLNYWSEAASDFNKSFRYLNYFTGTPQQIKKKHHDLLYFWADALVRKANLEDDKTRQLNYYKDAVNKIEDYLDRFDGYNSSNTKQMNANLKNFNNKIAASIN